MPITRFRVFSDLHLSFSDWTPLAAAAEAILPAGDIAVGPHLPDALDPGASDPDHLVRAPVPGGLGQT